MLPNPRLLLTGAHARRSRAIMFCFGTRGCAATPRQQKRRALGGNLISSFSTTEWWWDRPVREVLRAGRRSVSEVPSSAAGPRYVQGGTEFRATGIWAP